MMAGARCAFDCRDHAVGGQRIGGVEQRNGVAVLLGVDELCFIETSVIVYNL